MQTTPTSYRTDTYRRSHGNAPKGYGMWAFRIDGDIQWITATYHEAKKQTLRFARAQGARIVELMP